MKLLGLWKKTKGMLSDFGYNIVATVLVTAVLQIVVYPYLAGKFSEDEYGKLLTIMGLVNIFIATIGGAMNNVRLIQKSKYEEHNMEGDFNFLLYLFAFVGNIIFGIIIFTQFDKELTSLLLLLLIIDVGILENYWVVAFRLKINYKANLVYNVFLGIGYALGVVGAVCLARWELAFLLGEILGAVYLLKKTALYKEKSVRTHLFPKTMYIYISLMFTTLVANLVNYLDRLFLYPILGGEQVTIYTVSSFVGKSVGLLVTPIAGVLLSYYAQKSFVMTLKKYWLINLITIGLGSVAGLFVIGVGPWITGILYPTIVDATVKYAVVANVASLIGALSNVLMPSLLKFSNISWQIFLQVLYALVYIGLGYLFANQNGLFGFCMATLLANALRLIALLIIGHISISHLAVEK